MRGVVAEEGSLTPGDLELLARQRVVFVLPSLVGGGAERVSLSFLAGLAIHGVDAHLLVLSGDGPLAGSVPQGVGFHDLGKKRLRDALSPMVSTLRRLGPQAIYSTHGYVNLALLMSRPVFGRRTALLLREANTPSSSLASLRFTGLLRTGYRMLYPNADAIICQSRLMRAELRRDFGVPESRLHLIYNPTDEDGIRSGVVPEREPGEGQRFVAAGLFARKKGFDRLIGWFAEMDASAHLTLLGQGPMDTVLRDQVSRLGLAGRVSFPGHQLNPWRWIAGADAFLLPSRWEGMPNVVLESLACGVPVIATAESGGIQDVAEMAERGAVRIAHGDDEFIAMMRSVVPRRVGTTMLASCLPPVFRRQKAQEAFNALLAATLVERRS